MLSRAVCPLAIPTTLELWACEAMKLPCALRTIVLEIKVARKLKHFILSTDAQKPACVSTFSERIILDI
jgi:hypothetical protein